MNKMIHLLVILFLLSCHFAQADQVIDDDMKTATAFINEYPIVKGQVDEIGLVTLWQQTEGLKAMAFLHYKKSLPKQMSDELLKRSFLIPTNIGALAGSDDKVVCALAKLLLLDWKFLDKFTSGRLDYYDYSDVAIYTIKSGRVLAEMVEEKYGKERKIIKPEPAW